MIRKGVKRAQLKALDLDYYCHLLQKTERARTFLKILEASQETAEVLHLEPISQS